MSDPKHNRRRNLLTHEREPAPAKPPPVAETAVLVQEALARDGQPLASETRALVEPQFGHSLEDIRIHTDERAARATEALGALAFATGPNLFFAPGQYAPGTRAGDHLLTHEIAHTVQQARGPVDGRPLGDALDVSAPGDEHEREADRAADRIATRAVQREAVQRSAPPLPSSLFRPLHQQSVAPFAPPAPNPLTMFAPPTTAGASDGPGAADGEQASEQPMGLGLAPLPLARGGSGGRRAVQLRAAPGAPPPDDEELRQRLQPWLAQAEGHTTPNSAAPTTGQEHAVGQPTSKDHAGQAPLATPPTAGAAAATSRVAGVSPDTSNSGDISSQPHERQQAAHENGAPRNGEHTPAPGVSADTHQAQPAAEQTATAPGTKTRPSQDSVLSAQDPAHIKQAQQAQKGDVVRQPPQTNAPTAKDVSAKPPAEDLKQRGEGQIQTLKQAALPGGTNSVAPKRSTTTAGTSPTNGTATNRPPVESAGGAATAQRDAANAAVAQAGADLDAVQANATQLAATTIEFAADEPSVDDTEAAGPVIQRRSDDRAPEPPGAQAALAERRIAASTMVSVFMGDVSGRIATVSGLGQQVAEQIQPLIASSTATLMTDAEAHVVSIAATIAQQRTQAETQARAAQSQIVQQHEATSNAIRTATTTTRSQVDAGHTAALGTLAEHEQAQLQRIEQLYTQGDSAYRATGVTVGNEAEQIGQRRAAEYHSQRINQDDSFLDGALTDNRCDARADAAKQVAKGYKDGLIQEANKQADQAQQGKARDIEAVHTTVRQTRAALEAQYTATINTLAQAEEHALQQALDTQTSLLQNVEQTLQGIQQALAQQETTVIQAVQSAAEQQIVGVQQAGQQIVAGLQSSLSQAASSLLEAAQDVTGALQGKPVPQLDTLSAAFNSALGQIDGGVATIMAQSQTGIATAQQNLAQTAQQASVGLAANVQAISGELTASGAQAIETLNSLAQRAGDTFSQVQQAHTTATDEQATAATQGFEQVATGIGQTFDHLNQNIEHSFTEAAHGLEQGLRGALPKMQEEIGTQADEAASHVEPRWKSVVKWLVIIAIVVVVALVAGPFVIGAVGAAAGALGASAAVAGAIGTIVGGAIVGAATSAAIQVTTNWAQNRSLGEGVVRAAIIGAIGGAVGGAAGLGVQALQRAGAGVLGQLAQGAGGRFAMETVANVGVETIISAAQGHLTWESFGTSLLTAVAVGGALHAASGLTPVAGLQQRSLAAGEAFGAGAVNTTRAIIADPNGSLSAGERIVSPDRGLADMGEHPAPGTRSQTREEWQAQNSRERAERTVAAADQPLENPSPQAATEGHGHAAHGNQTTEAQQAERVRSGLRPDGEMGKRPGRASRFGSPEAEAEALGRGRRALESDLSSGTVPNYSDPATGQPTYVDPVTGAPVRHRTSITTQRPEGFGTSQVPQRDAAGNIIKDATGNRTPVADPAPLPNARVVWEYVPSTGEWQPVTYHPEP